MIEMTLGALITTLLGVFFTLFFIVAFSYIAYRKPRAIVISGYFLCFHKGHLEYLLEADKKRFDKVVVIINNEMQREKKYGIDANNEAWLSNHNGYTLAQLKSKIEKLLPDAEVIISSSKDMTVCSDLERLKEHYRVTFFKDGGEYSLENLPEAKVEDVRFIFGTSEKIDSSKKIIGENR